MPLGLKLGDSANFWFFHFLIGLNFLVELDFFNNYKIKTWAFLIIIRPRITYFNITTPNYIQIISQRKERRTTKKKKNLTPHHSRQLAGQKKLSSTLILSSLKKLLKSPHVHLYKVAPIIIGAYDPVRTRANAPCG